MKKYVVLFIESKWYSLNLLDQEDFRDNLEMDFKNTLITFQTTDLIREFNSNEFKKLPKIIDLKSFDKQFTQEGKDFKNKPWNAIRFLYKHNKIESDFKLNKDNFKLFLQLVSELYSELLENDDLEKNRFETTETEINKIIHNRQAKGLKVDYDLAKKKCKELEKQIYSAKNILQINHNIFTPNSIEFQEQFFKKKKYNIINSSLLYTFKTRSESDEICFLIYNLTLNPQRKV